MTEQTDQANDAFAHPTEVEIARLLDFYGVRWEYEPRSFVLSRSPAGLPTMQFTPDFYLPDHDLYLEITTVRPSLLRRKKLRLRRMRELYPDVRVKLFGLRDLEALLLKYGRSEASAGGAVGGKAKA